MGKESLLPKSSSSSIFFALASLTLVILGLIYFSGILKPLVIAFLIWFIISQLKSSLKKIKINGKILPSFVRSILAFMIIFGVLYLVAELLIVNIEGIVASMPEHITNLNQQFKNASSLIRNPEIVDYLHEWIQNLNLSAMATSALSSLSSGVANSAVVIVYVIFFLMEESTTKVKVGKLFPEHGKAFIKFQRNLKSINTSIQYYISSMVGISLLTAVVSYLILWIMGVEYAFLWAFLVFILNFIPYLGPLISSLLPAIFAVITTGELMQFVYIFALMEGVQIIIGNFIQPMVQGKGTNLGPITVIVSLAIWGMLWGITGMILAVPITATIVISCSQTPSLRYIAILLSEKGDIPDMHE